jgi:hypothetical protein
MSRKIQAPGIEINEIDYSSYDSRVNSLVNTTALVMGFADQGIDYSTRYVNTMNNYIRMFGVPKTEAETYLYNAANEIIKQGGNVFVSKLPYDNNVFNKYAYVDYFVDDNITHLSSPYDIITNNFNNITNYNYTELNLELPHKDYVTIEDFYYYINEILKIT